MSSGKLPSRLTCWLTGVLQGEIRGGTWGEGGGSRLKGPIFLSLI